MGRGSRLDFGKAFGQAKTTVQLVLQQRSKAIEKEIQHVLKQRARGFFRYIAEEFLNIEGGGYKTFSRKGFSKVTWRALAKSTIRRKQRQGRRNYFFQDGSGRGQRLKSFFRTVDPTNLYRGTSVELKEVSKKKVRYSYSLYKRTAEKSLIKGIATRSPLQAEKLMNPKGVKRQLMEPALRNYMAMRVNAQIIRRLKEKRLIK